MQTGFTSLEDAYNAFLDIVWRGGGGFGKPKVVEGKANGLECLRTVTGGVKEQIVAVDFPNNLTYRVLKGMLPFKSHRAFVEFTQPKPGAEVNLTWVVHYTPKRFTGPMSSLMVNSFFICASSALNS